jgi:hypothetical protein
VVGTPELWHFPRMSRHFRSVLLVPAVSVAALVSSSGCSKQPEPSASAPATKPTAAVGHGATTAAGPGAAAKGPGQVAWTDPTGWKREAPANAMRVAQYTLPAAQGDAEPAECVVTTFGPGQGGSTEQNLDRWIRQFAADDKTTLEKGTRTVSDLKVSTLEMSGTFRGMGDGGGKPGTRMLAAVVEAPSGLWFFKLTGPDATVKQAKPGFDALLGSLTATK